MHKKSIKLIVLRIIVVFKTKVRDILIKPHFLFIFHSTLFNFYTEVEEITKYINGCHELYPLSTNTLGIDRATERRGTRLE